MSFVFAGLAPEVIEVLTGGAKAALPYIIHGVTAGLSANRIGEALQEAGLGIRRASLLAAVRGVREAIVGGEIMEGLKAEELPPPGVFQGSLTFMQRNYAYIVEVHGVNATTGAAEVRHITVSTDSILSGAALEEYVGDVLEAGFNSYQMEMDSYDVTQVLVDPRILP